MTQTESARRNWVTLHAPSGHLQPLSTLWLVGGDQRASQHTQWHLYGKFSFENRPGISQLVFIESGFFPSSSTPLLLPSTLHKDPLKGSISLEDSPKMGGIPNIPLLLRILLSPRKIFALRMNNEKKRLRCKHRPKHFYLL